MQIWAACGWTLSVSAEELKRQKAQPAEGQAVVRSTSLAAEEFGPGLEVLRNGSGTGVSANSLLETASEKQAFEGSHQSVERYRLLAQAFQKSPDRVISIRGADGSGAKSDETGSSNSRQTKLPRIQLPPAPAVPALPFSSRVVLSPQLAVVAPDYRLNPSNRTEGITDGVDASLNLPLLTMVPISDRPELPKEQVSSHHM